MTDVNAYIDPSVMTYAIQAIAGIAIALGTVFGIYWRKIRSVLFHDSFDQKIRESDNLEFRDPASSEIRALHFSEQTAQKEEKKPFREFPAAVMLSVAMGFMLCFYTPLEIYFTNIFEFEYDVYAIFRYILLLFLIVTAVLISGFFLVRLISKKLFFGCVVLGLIAFLAFYIQGNFLIGDLPPSDGTEVDWSMFRAQEMQSLILWIAVTAAVILFAVVLKRKKFLNFTKFITSAITAVLAVTLVIVCVRNNGLQRKTQLCISHEGLAEMSSDKNFVIFVVDAVDSKTFADLMNSEDPYFADVFEDFTYYPDTLAVYPFTVLAVPHILTGERYLCQDEFRSYYTGAMKQSPILRRLKNENYVRAIYDVQDVVFEDPEFFEYENIFERPYGLGSAKTFMLDELRMAFFLYMPYQLKRYEPYALFNLQNEKAAEYYYQWYDPWFYDYFDDHKVEVKPEKRFRYIHIEGAHPPYRYNRDLEDVEDTDEASYEANVEACVTVLEKYLQSLKDSGTYDNSAVIILADHGYADKVHSSGRQNPLLLIKGFNEKHAMLTSDAAIGYDDLQEIYQNLLDGKSGEAVLPENTGPERSRSYIQFEYDDLNHLTELELTGAKADDFEALKPTGKTYSRE